MAGCIPKHQDLLDDDESVPLSFTQNTIGFHSYRNNPGSFVTYENNMYEELSVIIKLGGQLKLKTAIKLADAFQFDSEESPIMAGVRALDELTTSAVKKLKLDGYMKAAITLETKIDHVLENGSIGDKKRVINRMIDGIGAFVWCDESPWSIDDACQQDDRMQAFHELCERSYLAYKKRDTVRKNITKVVKRRQIKKSLKAWMISDSEFKL